MTAREQRPPDGCEPTLLDNGPKAATHSGTSQGNLVVSEDQPPPDPRLVELTRIAARLAARQWYASQRRG